MAFSLTRDEMLAIIQDARDDFTERPSAEVLTERIRTILIGKYPDIEEERIRGRSVLDLLLSDLPSYYAQTSQ